MATQGWVGVDVKSKLTQANISKMVEFSSGVFAYDPIQEKEVLVIKLEFGEEANARRTVDLKTPRSYRMVRLEDSFDMENSTPNSINSLAPGGGLGITVYDSCSTYTTKTTVTRRWFLNIVPALSTDSWFLIEEAIWDTIPQPVAGWASLGAVEGYAAFMAERRRDVTLDLLRQAIYSDN
ncbi:hypothetical protein NUW58_g3330 [Xylaria curta]|uniref:Uncharacterized protein n=1 Tax=Xylaria curta TaxID=42375 RepID=A0ACC1PD27_9PEZI|nr:hypothetical protein NUW58_g3330 [Xylaria curta]